MILCIKTFLFANIQSTCDNVTQPTKHMRVEEVTTICAFVIHFISKTKWAKLTLIGKNVIPTMDPPSQQQTTVIL